MPDERRKSWVRRIAYIGAIGMLAFASGLTVQAAFTPDTLPKAYAADTGTCDGTGTVELSDTHPGRGLHLGHETDVVYEGTAQTSACSSDTAIASIAGAGGSSLDGTCLEAIGEVFGETESRDAAGRKLGKSAGRGTVVLTNTANNALRASVTHFEIETGFMQGAFGAGAALTVDGFLESCLLGAEVTGGSGSGSGNANR